MRWTRKKKVIWGASRALKWSDCQMGRGMKRTAGQGLGIGGESWLGSWKSSWTSQFESCQGVQDREIWRVSPRYRGGGTLEGVDGTDGGIGRCDHRTRQVDDKRDIGHRIEIHGSGDGRRTGAFSSQICKRMSWDGRTWNRRYRMSPSQWRTRYRETIETGCIGRCAKGAGKVCWRWLSRYLE
jgi:hypothetical protein